MKRHKHLYEQVCSFENLHAAAIKALRGKRRKRPGSAFFAEMEDELPALREELLAGPFSPDIASVFSPVDVTDSIGGGYLRIADLA